MTAEQLAKNFERMVITSERLKKFPNGRPERLNGRSKISNGLSWTAERLVKNFERMVIWTGEKRLVNGFPFENGKPLVYVFAWEVTFCPKTNIKEISNFWPKSWVNPFEKIQYAKYVKSVFL